MSGTLKALAVYCPNCQAKHGGKDGNYYCPTCEAYFQRMGLATYIGNDGILRCREEGGANE